MQDARKIELESKNTESGISFIRAVLDKKYKNLNLMFNYKDDKGYPWIKPDTD